ncbi:MAG: hypothetical protein U9Q95_01005 [Candidatus Eisenbacteria bacterium]|nr:hypothetical protein [Candidatus Eisenbacteria bacterium]
MRRFALRPSVLTRLPLTALAVVVLFAAGCTCRVPEAEPVSDETRATYSTDERPMSSLELIEVAVRSGILEYSTGLLYKVYTMFDPSSLPPEYESAVPSKCGTPLISEVQRNWNMLSPDDRAEISQYIEPIGMPGETGTQLDDVTPDRLNHEREKLD